MLSHLISSAVAALAVYACWLMLRCRVGFHGHVVLESRGGDIDWRCERCMRIAGTTTARSLLQRDSTEVELEYQQAATISATASSKPILINNTLAG